MFTATVEKYRGNTDKTKGNNREAQRLSLDEMPRTEKMRVGTHRRCYTGNYNNLKRWLVTQVGQPWATVYAVVVGKTPKNSLERIHLDKSLDGMVNTAVTEQDGKIFDRGHELRPGSLYINAAGVLSRIPPKAVVRPESRKLVTFTGQMEGVGQDASGQWFVITFNEYIPRPDAQTGKDEGRHDLFLKDTITDRAAVLAYGRAIIATSKRAMSKADIRKFKQSRS